MNQNNIKLILLIAVFLFGSVIISNSGIFSQARIDLTENKLFTLSEGTINILNTIDEEIQLKVYFSEEATRQIPLLRIYKDRVLDLITEMQKSSSGKLKVSVIDPKIFTPEEDEASQFGLQALPVGDSGSKVFFGLVGENSIDTIEVIPFLQPDRETYLEFDIAQLIYSLNNPERLKVGVMSSIDMKESIDEKTGTRVEEQLVLGQLKKNYEVEYLNTSIESIDEGIKVLMLIHPKNLSDKTLFAIDQFVLRGGRLLAFVDPMSQNQPVESDPNNPMAAFQADRSSSLPKLFSAWGIEFDTEKVVLDEEFALSIQTQQGARPQRHLAFLALKEKAFNDADIATRELETVNFAVSGFFNSDNLAPILVTSDNPSLTNSQSLKFLSDPNSLFKNYKSENKELILAGRINSKIETAFPEGVEGKKPVNFIQSNDNPNVVLFADVDLLFNQLWVRSQNFFGRKVFSSFADNGNLIVNLVDSLAGSQDLIHIRGRKNSARPFTKVIELQDNSNKKFQETENSLKQKLRETEQKINDLQREKGSQNRLILSQEQELEIQKFQAEKLDVRKKLREVRRNLDKDIQDLGTKLKFINIGLIPIVICLFAIFILWFWPKKKNRKSYAK